MGSGSYTSSDWNKLKASRAIKSDSNEREIFKNRNLLEKFDPKYIGVRESRDSDEHPHSTPIAIGLDVTGSMGYLPTEIIKNGLDELMKKLYASQVIPDPQLMFAACGDYKDDAPLQVTQFESDIRIGEQLMELWLEGGGYGNGGEDYQLFWYFLAKHTDTDSMKKRNQKGFAFTIGDEAVHDTIYDYTFKKVFKENRDSMPTSEARKLCEEKYHLFHINIDGYQNNHSQVPGRTLAIDQTSVKYLPEVIITVICKVLGKNPTDILGDLDPSVQRIVNSAIKNVQFDNYGSVIEV